MSRTRGTTGNEALRNKLFGKKRQRLDSVAKSSKQASVSSPTVTESHAALLDCDSTAATSSDKLSCEKPAEQGKQQKHFAKDRKGQLTQLLETKGIAMQVALVASEVLANLPAVDARRLLAGLGRRPELIVDLNAGRLAPSALVELSDDDLATKDLVTARQLLNATSTCTDDGSIALTCPECDAENAKGAYINSCAFSKPMLGRAHVVLRGECIQCGHVWLNGD